MLGEKFQSGDVVRMIDILPHHKNEHRYNGRIITLEAPKKHYFISDAYYCYSHCGVQYLIYEDEIESVATNPLASSVIYCQPSADFIGIEVVA